ncbi:MAG: sigma-70 family RNA polymerase sigma factor [Oscillospiraceae bacterium]|nr:sigma-70 family RNA polymerase sigma factor [Oscillospiraceae bacterium]
MEFDGVVEKYSNTVFRIAYSMTKSREDSEDVYQDVFLRYLRAAPEFESEEHRRAWLIRVTVNRAKSLFASAWTRRTTGLDENVPAPEARGEEDGVYRAVQELPQKYRAVIHLYYYEDMPIEEIARAVGGKPNTIASQLHRARALLREKLKGDYNDL